MSLTITEPGLVRNLDEREYHADPVQGGSLSSTMAKTILKSPAHLRHYLDAPRESKPAFDFGSVVHTLVLGTGWEVEVLDYPGWQTNEARDARDEIQALGKVAILRKHYEQAEAAAVSVLEHPQAGKLFKRGEAEVSAFGKHESGVWLRGRFDWTVAGHLVDLKSAATADPNEFARSAYNFGYHVQQEHYRLAHYLATGEWPKGFLFVLVEKEPPYAVSVVRLTDRFSEIGKQRLSTAIARYKQATTTGQWAGYPTHIHEIDAKPYMADMEEDE